MDTTRTPRPSARSTNRSTTRPTRARAALLAGAALVALTACGGGDDGVAVPDGGGASSESSGTGGSGGSGNGGSGGSSAGGGGLLDTPIAWSSVVDPDGSLGVGGSNPIGGATPSLDTCPLLATASIDSLDDTFDPDQLSLTSATTTRCQWDGPYFGFAVEVESAADVPIDDHSGRAYNLDVEPVAEPQDGPGTNAVLLVDTAFEDLGSDGYPYAYFFVLDGQAVTLSTYVLQPDPAQWRSFADEVAAAISAGTAGLDAPMPEAPPVPDEAPATAGEPCTYYTLDEVAGVLGVDPSSISVALFPLGTTIGCEWTSGDAVLTIRGSNLANDSLEDGLARSSTATDISDQVGAPAVQTTELEGEVYVLEGEFGANRLGVYVIGPDAAPIDGALATVLGNLAARLFDDT